MLSKVMNLPSFSCKDLISKKLRLIFLGVVIHYPNTPRLVEDFRVPDIRMLKIA